MPRIAYFDVTNQCNLNCPHCYNAGKNKGRDLPITQCKQIIDILKGNGFTMINFVGGEPFTRKDLYAIVNYANRVGVKTAIATNSTTLTDEKAKRFSKSKILMSLDYFGKRHDRFRNVEGLFVKIAYFLKNLPNTYIRTTIMRDNINDCRKLIKMSKEAGKIWLGVPMKPVADMREPTSNQLAEIYKLAWENDMRVIDPPFTSRLCGKFNKKYNGCFGKCRNIHILYNGDCTLCEFMSEPVLGNIFRDSIEKMQQKGRVVARELTDKKSHMFSVSGGQCPDCELFGKCCKLTKSCAILGGWK